MLQEGLPHKENHNTFDTSELDNLTARNKKLDILIQRLFEKNTEGGLPKETYNRMMKSYTEEYETNKKRIEDINNKNTKNNEEKNYTTTTERFIKRIEKVAGKEINRNVIISIIEKIFIYKNKNDLKIKIQVYDIPELLEDYTHDK